MAQHPDYDAVERLTFSLNAKDRVLGTEDPTVYVVWEGGSKEAVHGFVLRWGQRAIHLALFRHLVAGHATAAISQRSAGRSSPSRSMRRRQPR
jgi:hypothetical protein